MLDVIEGAARDARRGEPRAVLVTGPQARLFDLITALLRGLGAQRPAALLIDDLLLARVHELPPAARRLVEIAAVGGRRAPHGLLAAASGLDRTLGALLASRLGTALAATGAWDAAAATAHRLRLFDDT